MVGAVGNKGLKAHRYKRRTSVRRFFLAAASYRFNHHATERFGIQALGEHLAKQFGLEHRIIDQDNPV